MYYFKFNLLYKNLDWFGSKACKKFFLIDAMFIGFIPIKLAWKNKTVANPPIKNKADLLPLLKLNLTTVRFKKLGVMLPRAAIIKPKHTHVKKTIV